MKLTALFDYTLLRFVLVGIVNTLVAMALMFGFYNFADLGYWLSTALTNVFASVLSFFLNKYFTFRAKSWSVKMIAGFIFTIVGAYVIAYSAAKPVIYALLERSSQKIRDNVSMLLGMCLFTGLNYFGQRFIAFRTEKKEGAKQNDEQIKE